MSDRTDNVFPNYCQDGYELSQIVGGITKREYFAAIAMQGILASNIDYPLLNDHIASQSALLADTLIAALNKEIPE